MCRLSSSLLNAFVLPLGPGCLAYSTMTTNQNSLIVFSGLQLSYGTQLLNNEVWVLDKVRLLSFVSPSVVVLK
jgi:hypothetical protein